MKGRIAIISIALVALLGTGAAYAADGTSAAAALPEQTAAALENTEAPAGAASMQDLIAAALDSADRQAVPGGFTAPQPGMTEVQAPYQALAAEGELLYINEARQLVRRAEGVETVLAEAVHGITHVSGEKIYLLLDRQGEAQSAPAQGSGWDDPVTTQNAGAPENARDLNGACDWAVLDTASGELTVLLENAGSVPVVCGGTAAYALDWDTGAAVRVDMAAQTVETLFTPADGSAIALSPAPQGVILARYDAGILTGCAAVDGGSAVAVNDRAAGAVFKDGVALSVANAGDGTGRAGIYVETGSGEIQLDADARADWLYSGGKLYYWHADPEQAYGFCDLYEYDPATGANVAVPAGAQLRSVLFEYGGAIYMTNYDSELYIMNAAADEPEYIMDLTVDHDFDSDIMPSCALYEQDGVLNALLYVDEGDGYKFIGDVHGE